MHCCAFSSAGLPCDCWIRENRESLNIVATDTDQEFWNIVSESYTQDEYADMILRAKEMVAYFKNENR